MAKMKSNADDLYYTTSMYVGTGQPKQKMNFVVDTGTSTVWVHGPNCQGCPGSAYRFERSHTFRTTDNKGVIIDKRRNGLDAGGAITVGKISGREVSEVFSLENGSLEAEDIDMVFAEKVEGDVDEIKADGWIGFMPRRQKKHLPLPFVTQIFKKGLIRRNMFAMHFSEKGAQLWIGGYPKEYLKKTFTEFTGLKLEREYEDKFAWVPMNKKARDWTSTITKFTIIPAGESEAASDRSFPTDAPVKFDTGVLFTKIPPGAWNNLLTALRATKGDCGPKKVLKYRKAMLMECTCVASTMDDEFPILDLDIGPSDSSHTIKMLPSQYMLVDKDVAKIEPQ